MNKRTHSIEFYQKKIERLEQKVKELEKKQRYLKRLLKLKIKD